MPPALHSSEQSRFLHPACPGSPPPRCRHCPAGSARPPGERGRVGVLIPSPKPWGGQTGQVPSDVPDDRRVLRPAGARREVHAQNCEASAAESGEEACDRPAGRYCGGVPAWDRSQAQMAPGRDGHSARGAQIRSVGLAPNGLPTALPQPSLGLRHLIHAGEVVLLEANNRRRSRRQLLEVRLERAPGGPINSDELDVAAVGAVRWPAARWLACRGWKPVTPSAPSWPRPPRRCPC